MLKSMEVLRRQKLAKKNKAIFYSKQIEKKLLIELKDKLGEHLAENDKFMIEIPMNVSGEFINILSSPELSMYELVEQVDTTKYIFRNKEIVF